MTDQTEYYLSIVERLNEKLNYCQYLNSLEFKKYLSGLNDLLNDT